MTVQGWYEQEPPPAGARCARHPEIGAVMTCGRCGSFACDECVLRGRDGVMQPVCRSCAGPFGLLAGASWFAIGALLCSFFGFGCGVTAPVGIVLAVIDLVRMSGRQAPPGGKTLDVLAIVLGAVAVLIWVLIAKRFLFDMTEADFMQPADDPWAP